MEKKVSYFDKSMNWNRHGEAVYGVTHYDFCSCNCFDRWLDQSEQGLEGV